MFLLAFFIFNMQMAVLQTNKPGFGGYTIIGHSTSIDDYPSLVGLRGNDKRCTGTLIKRNFILTAAHCLETPPTGAYIGSTVITEGYVYKLRKSDMFQHPGFNGNVTERTDDIALLKTQKLVKLSKRVTVAKMARKDDVFKVGTICKMAGWGDLDQDHQVGTNILHEAEMRLAESKVCGKEGTINKETELCVSVIPELNEITAKGDSGTSLWCKKEGGNQYLLAGVDSRGNEGHTIFTKVSFYHDWIDKVLNSN